MYFINFVYKRLSFLSQNLYCIYTFSLHSKIKQLKQVYTEIDTIRTAKNQEIKDIISNLCNSVETLREHTETPKIVQLKEQFNSLKLSESTLSQSIQQQSEEISNKENIINKRQFYNSIDNIILCYICISISLIIYYIC